MSTETTVIDRLLRSIETKRGAILAAVSEASRLIITHQRETGDVSRACRLLAAVDGMAVQRNVLDFFHDTLPHSFRRTADGWKASEKDKGKILVRVDAPATTYVSASKQEASAARTAKARETRETKQAEASRLQDADKAEKSALFSRCAALEAENATLKTRLSELQAALDAALVEGLREAA